MGAVADWIAVEDMPTHDAFKELEDSVTRQLEVLVSAIADLAERVERLEKR